LKNYAKPSMRTEPPPFFLFLLFAIWERRALWLARIVLLLLVKVVLRIAPELYGTIGEKKEKRLGAVKLAAGKEGYKLVL
jgi:hypothetical protein